MCLFKKANRDSPEQYSKSQANTLGRLKKNEKKLNFFQPAQKTVLDCKASLKTNEFKSSGRFSKSE
jgi:hypothetical protein